MLDGAQIGPPSVVIAGVSGVRLRYRIGADWIERWDSTRPEAMPQVVEAVIDLPRFGAVRQLFLTGIGL
jgi:general secretion pathway protein J